MTQTTRKRINWAISLNGEPHTHVGLYLYVTRVRVGTFIGLMGRKHPEIGSPG